MPAGYNPDDTVCVRVPIKLVPIIGALLRTMEFRALWVTQADWIQGRQAAYLLQERLVMDDCP
jgi:hypothetical protein